MILWGSEFQSNQSFLGMLGLFDTKVHAVKAGQIHVELKSLTFMPLFGDCSLGTARVPDLCVWVNYLGRVELGEECMGKIIWKE